MYFWPLGKVTLSKSVKYKGAKVVYSQLGGGETIVLLHGFLEERSMWDGIASELSKTNNVICVDLLGQGESDCLGYIHSMNDHAGAVKQVLDTEKINQCLVIGHSMGGYVALELANLYPSLITGLALFHSTAYADSEEKKVDRQRVIDLAQRNKDVFIKAVIPTLFAEGSLAELSKEISNVCGIASKFTLQGIVANIRGMMERESRTDILKDGVFPKLIIHGKLDAVIPDSDMHEQSQLNNNITLKEFQGIGHMGHLEAPEACLAVLKEFASQ
jgi:pimeloyl-ACP methyl ester carboxylesterase